jgi:hypothetical protein
MAPKELLIKALKFDRSKYERYRDTHPENWVHYVNRMQASLLILRSMADARQ